GLVHHGLHVREHVDAAVSLALGQPQRLEFLEALQAVADGTVIGEGAAEPAFADVGHPAAERFALDGFLGLALGADEQHELPLTDRLGQEAATPEQAADRFAQVDDMDEIPLAVNVRPHLRVPAAGAMPIMHAGLDQLLHLNDRHIALPVNRYNARVL